MDALSDLLQVVKLNGALFLDSRFTAPWCVESRPARESGGIFAGLGHIVFFHAITHGQCRVRLCRGGETLQVRAGDLLLLPHDDAHYLGSDLQLAAVMSDTLVQPASPGHLMRIDHGGGGEETRFICGFLACEPQLCRPLLDALPHILRVPLTGGGWLPDLLYHAAHSDDSDSAHGPGSASVKAKLAELLFLEAIRRYIDALPPHQTGWLAGLRDPYVGRALNALHERPAHAWSVEELGTHAGLSRSALAQRFNALIGMPPMHYLTRWRLCRAAAALQDTRRPVAALAGDCGYESEAAFNRAFKREFGMPPAAWRRKGRRSVVTL
ncbi:MAG TPA: AraC family transcriptional regulator [Rhodanobacter sp.]|nr:AraC family transcriptional regulator [Rhodanobacter sp.]